MDTAQSQINNKNVESTNGVSSGSNPTTAPTTGSNPFMNCVFTQPRNSAQKSDYFATVLPKGVGNKLVLDC